MPGIAHFVLNILFSNSHFVISQFRPHTLCMIDVAGFSSALSLKKFGLRTIKINRYGLPEKPVHPLHQVRQTARDSAFGIVFA